jgi:hypothetical protein
MNTLKKIIFLLAFLLLYSGVNAQKGLSIESIFQAYGKRDGSVLIELAKDVLGNNHTKINLYKSLIVSSDSAIVNASLKAILSDRENGSILLESQKNGKIETGYYCLEKKENSPDYEYILFTNKSRKMTLIYLKGNFPPSRLEEELDQLKNLFLKVNNKRIKL